MPTIRKGGSLMTLPDADKLNALGLYIKNNGIDILEVANQMGISKDALRGDLMYQGDIHNKAIRFYFALADVTKKPLQEILQEIDKLDANLKEQREVN